MLLQEEMPVSLFTDSLSETGNQATSTLSKIFQLREKKVTETVCFSTQPKTDCTVKGKEAVAETTGWYKKLYWAHPTWQNKSGFSIGLISETRLVKKN